MVVILTYYRFYVPGREEHDTVEEAIASGFFMIEHNSAAPDEVLDVNGDVILTHEALREKICEYLNQYDEEGGR